jgi:hypothetical protein
VLFASAPFYNYSFGSLGRTLETACLSEFLRWFHLRESSRTPDPPGECIEFHSAGEKFRDLWHLEIRSALGGEMVCVNLIVRRSFIESNEGLFAQDLVKSFLFAALPDACRSALHDFMAEMNEPYRNGETLGYTTFRGRHPEWHAETGWSRLVLANTMLSQGTSLVVQVSPNPTAPNAIAIPAAQSAGIK